MISEKKLKAFALGEMGRRGVSKKEVQEAKQRQEKEAVGKAYQEFVDTFDSCSSSPAISKTWVKAGTFDAGSRKMEESGEKTLYKPKSKLLHQSKSSGSSGRPSSNNNSSKRPEKPGGSRKKTTEKKKSNLEMFKEELKAIQEEREERHRVKALGGSSNGGGGGGSGSGGGGGGGMGSSGSSTSSSRMNNSSESSSGTKEVSGSHDSGDPNTTNLYLGNLSPRLTEQQMLEIFGKYGPLASIKIMWPRTEDEKSRGRNCGFVAYMSRKDGERALSNLLGRDIDGFEMKMGWGKPVPIPLHPIYVPPKLLKLTLPPPPTDLPFNCQPEQKELNKLGCRLPLPPPQNEKETQQFNKLLFRSKIKVVIPTDRTQLSLINRLIEFIVREGPMFEAMIMNREMGNPSFRFLFENKSPEHIYYRWKLYSFLQGDTKDNWSLKEFRMFKGGSIWIPPPINLYTSGMPEELVENDGTQYPTSSAKSDKKDRKSSSTHDMDDEEAARNNRRGLSDSQRDRFEEMLRNLVPDRNPIAEAMVWCIEHADAGKEIVECISEALSISETPLCKKIARLYLISDILHNCSVKGVPNVSYYRKGFQAKLPDIFENLYECHKVINSRIKAESFKQRVMLCFRAWEDWALYPQDFLIRLQNKFLGLSSSFSNTADDSNRGDDEDVTPTRDTGGGGGDVTDDDDVDGIPLDGAALLKSAAKTTNSSQRIRRPAINRDSDDSDIDGAPISESVRASSSLINRRNQKNTSTPGFVPSKWETVDPEDVQAQAVTSKWDIFDEYDNVKKSKWEDDDLDGVPMQDDDDEQERKSEARRSKLRDIELKVMSYQDELESGRKSSKSGWTISEQVEHFRKKLIKKELKSDGNDSEDDRSRPSSKRSGKSSRRNRSSSSSRSRSRSRERRRRRRRSSSSNGSYDGGRKRSRSRSPSSRSRSRRSRSRSPKKHKKKRH